MISKNGQTARRAYNGRTKDGHRDNVIIFGAGDGGRRITESLLNDANSRFHPVAILDDDEALHGASIQQLIVRGGRQALSDVVAETGAMHLLIAIPSASGTLVRSLETIGNEAGLRVCVLPTVAELVGRAISPSDIRDITPADLLGRRPVDLDLERRGSYVTGARVLVTGAGGSIGSELSRQLNLLNPAELLLLDRDESALHALQLSLDGQGQLQTDRLIIADIRDSVRMDSIFKRWKPDVVFHAAALKHLPLLELHPDEGLKTNVCGTHNLLSAARHHGVERFVNVSTDKAADPSSVLGYTKRLAERLTTEYGEQTQNDYVSVRFGNVLGSRGSVLPAFTAQIARGGPVTVTHPDVTRYLMTIEEASSLVIIAGAQGCTGDVLILDMGEPVRILDVANELISRSGKDVEIIYTGLRPGEKMHEVLRSGEETIAATEDGLMWRGTVDGLCWNAVESLLSVDDNDVLVHELSQLAGAANKERPMLLLSPPEVGDIEHDALNRALDSGWIAPAGEELNAFESELAEQAGTEAAIAVNSGSAALHLGLLVCGVEPGDEVIVQTSTFAASAFAVVHAGAIPIFCDVDRRTGSMDPDKLADFLAERARLGRVPRAIMPVDLYGRCADYEAINAIADQYGIAVVQDAAEAIGAVSQRRPAGSHGTVGVFSFNGNKIITTSAGGALVGPKPLIDRATKLAGQAREPVAHYEHREIGFNYRMSNLLAALGRAQLQRLDERICERGRLAANYRAALPAVEWFPEGVTESPNNWLNVALLPDGIDPAHAAKTLVEKGIEARVSWKPMHLQPVFADAISIGGCEAEWFYARGLCLPSGQAMTPRDAERVVEALSLAVLEGTNQATTR